jgi:predicted nucleic acid-binding protein
LDTSLLVPCYVTEPRSAEATAIIAQGTELVVSTLAVQEARMALMAKERHGHIDAAVRVRAEQQILEDLRVGVYRSEIVPLHAFDQAPRIAERVPHAVRLLDATHAWMAESLHLTMATLDKNLHRVSLALGIPVVPAVMTPHPITRP